ncbi:class E sortase [Streptomyces sp. H27-D2]|uniref:class E sortase n=1 Tax=Streptomyces sp. H27-D2 TaxID=3046304 RepID=UPI002DBF7135|nr:class E sortase [Streptomyces sp. H27-D2]MEC4015163.1 class E sortase [Streptomyces sp. H27-D2]
MRQRIPVVVQGRRKRRSRELRRARRPRSGRVLAARALWSGAEIAVTLGVVVLLLVAHQLWWTNRQARAEARQQVEALERDWRSAPDTPVGETGEPGAGSGRDPAAGPDAGAGGARSGGGGASAGSGGAGRTGGAAPPGPPRWDQAYAVLRIPKLGVTAPVAQGISKSAVLNKGYVGHYAHTAQPGRPGNFALAGHRNTHGEPFRHINRLRAGDLVRIDTADARYTYAVERTLPQTSAADGTVLAEVPHSSVRPSYRYDAPGYYLTLTTCTPEYTSKYRLVVWGRLKSAVPR